MNTHDPRVAVLGDKVVVETRIVTDPAECHVVVAKF